jgi:hypothetical protein
MIWLSEKCDFFIQTLPAFSLRKTLLLITLVPWGITKEGVPLQEAVAQAREKTRQMKEDGVDQAALDAAAAKGY